MHHNSDFSGNVFVNEVDEKMGIVLSETEIPGVLIMMAAAHILLLKAEEIMESMTASLIEDAEKS